ncbi:MAG: hypothetical protein HWD61_09995 [Parachlamydiaceae bacterium]|nr:MAG: hypothetical protein HWD61_09995 [Parachlamydiaceae bacterium]
MMDSGGIYGAYLHYGLIIFMVGSAFIVFFYLWKKGRLDMDEAPKFQMLDNEEEKS